MTEFVHSVLMENFAILLCMKNINQIKSLNKLFVTYEYFKSFLRLEVKTFKQSLFLNQKHVNVN